MSAQRKLQKLEDSKLWSESQKVATYIYELVDQLPEEEKINLQYRLRARAFDVTSDIAEATGSINPKDTEYSMGLARRGVFAIKNAYKFLGTQKIIEVDPDFMLQLNNMLNEIDTHIKEAWNEIDSVQKEKAQ